MTPSTHAQSVDTEDLPALTTPSATAEVERNRERSFWMGLLYAGVIGYWTVGPVLLVYGLLTFEHRNRDWIIAIAVVALGSMVVVYLLRRKIVASRCREWIFFLWSIASFTIIAVLCILDGGITSPITYVFALPMLYLAIGYPLRAALVSGSAGLACYGAVLWIAPGPVAISPVLFQVLTLAVGFLLAILGARNRGQQGRALDVLRRKLETLAMTDALTGCLNQRAFTLALQREVEHAARYGRALSLLLIDVDHFKHINDRHGHLVGDAVLRKVGTVLRCAAREADCVGRPGGDELALLAPETDSVAALALAERVREKARSAVVPIDITLSIGICAMASAREQAADLFQRADEAMYVAKRRGRDQVALWNVNDVLSVRSALKRASGTLTR